MRKCLNGPSQGARLREGAHKGSKCHPLHQRPPLLSFKIRFNTLM